MACSLGHRELRWLREWRRQIVTLRARATHRDELDDPAAARVASVARELARLLLRLEADCYADARPCPFCNTSGDGNRHDEALAHARDCDLDRVLTAAGLRDTSSP
jgi:hypothetical protein